MTNIIKIATRKSPMALWQANHIKNQLSQMHPNFQIELVGFITNGDRNLSTPLNQCGGKSLFVKELQVALLNNEADIAVHCIKDMSVHPHPNLMLGAVCNRDDPRDAFVSNRFNGIEQLPEGAQVGTSSPRRQSQLLAMRSDLRVRLLRGNVNTRLSKLDNAEYDAIILAAAGLHRLNFKNRIKQYLDPENFIPAIGQGALGIECRNNDQRMHDLISPLHHAETASCIIAERKVNRVLGGDCYTPVGAHAKIIKNELMLRGIVGSLDGKTILQAQAKGDPNDAETIGATVANSLIAKGAKKYLS